MIQDEKILDKVNSLIEDCKTSYVELETGKTETDAKILYNQRELIRRINFYLNDQFLERDDNAIFWNISTPRIPHFAKLLQGDTKDFLPMGEGEYNFVQAWALRILAKQWFRDEQFYQTLNDLAVSISNYGGVVWKECYENGKKELEEVRLNNLYFDQTIDEIQDTDIVEMHYLSKNELWEKNGIWKNVEQVIEKTDKTARVWEYTGYLIEGGKPVYKHIIGYGETEQEFVELWSEPITKNDCPYESFRLGKYNGRFLGIGVVERLFKLQEDMNELINQNSETRKIASLLLFRSDNPDFTGNVLEQAENGQIVPDGTFQQVGVTNQGISQFLNDYNLINQQADKLCMTPEIIQGEQSPSNTTFRGLAVVNAAAENAFTIPRQNLLEKVSSILMKRIFPDVVKQWNKKTFVEIAQDDADVEVYDKALKNKIAIERMLNGELITNEILDEIENQIADNVKMVGRKIEFEKGFFNFKFGFKMQPTSETGDKMAQNDANYNAISMVSYNPAVYELPQFRQYCEDNKISYWKLTPRQKQALEQSAGNIPEQKKQDTLLASAKPQT